MRKTITSIALLTILTAAPQAADMYQSCDGVLARDAYGGYSLDSNTASGRMKDGSQSLWCDADLDNESGNRALDRVLKVCTLGDRCHIEGTFRGHGTFVWVRVTKVMRK